MQIKFKPSIFEEIQKLIASAHVLLFKTTIIYIFVIIVGTLLLLIIFVRTGAL